MAVQQSNTITENHELPRFVISAESLAILCLVLVSIVIRIYQLGSVPIFETEIQQALAAVEGTDVSASPLLYWAQRLAISVFGSTEFALRIVTALVGAGLSLIPLLFYNVLGKSRAFVFAVMLVFSPVLFAASRSSSGVVWSMALVGLGLYCATQIAYSVNRNYNIAVVGIVAFGAAALLTEPAGLLLVLIVVLAFMSSLFLIRAAEGRKLTGIVEALKRIPWGTGGVFLILVVMAVSTGFLLYPGGLGMVAALLGNFAAGWFEPSSSGLIFDGATALINGNPIELSVHRPFAFPLVVSFFYETWLWMFAVAAIVLVAYRREVSFIEWFFVAWIILAAVTAVLYQGTGAAHALWLIVPLAGLASYLINDALSEDDAQTLWLDGFIEDSDNSSALGKWLLAVVVFCLLIMTTLHFQIVSRGLINVPDGSLAALVDRLNEPGFNREARSLIWLIISGLFIIIGYFLVASVWGSRAAARGGVLGVFIFMLVSGLAVGNQVIVNNVDDASELWHTNVTLPGAALLGDTLNEIAFRETLGFPVQPITVVGDEESLIAWLLRDFDNVTFVDEISQAVGDEIVLTSNSNITPDLGGSYLGQTFDVASSWDFNTLQGLDFLPWWSTAAVRPSVRPVVQWILWVRQDIYNSQPYEPSFTPGLG